MEPEKQAQPIASQPLNINVRKPLETVSAPETSFPRRAGSLYDTYQTNRATKPSQENSSVENHAKSEDEKDGQKLGIRILDKCIGLSIFMLFFGLPIFFTGLTQQGIIFDKQIYFYVWILLGLVVWVTKGVVVGEMQIRRTPLDWPILGFWLAYGAATVFSVDRWHSFWGTYGDPSLGFMSITAYVIAYYFIFSNFNLKRLNLIFIATIFSGAISMIWTTLAIFGLKFLPDSIAAYAPLSLAGSITGLGMTFSILIPIITVAILKVADSKTLGKGMKITLESVMLFFLTLDLFLILALYNYVAWLGLFIGIAVFLIFILAKLVRPKSTWVWLPMAVFVLVMVLRLTGSVPITKIQLPMEVSLNYKTSADIAWASFKSRPLTGSGAATYGYDFSLNRPQDFNSNALYSLRFYQGTGILAEVIPAAGVIGAIFLVILILTYLGSQFYLLYKDKEKNKLYSLGLSSAAIIFLIDILGARADGGTLVMGVLFGTLALAVAMRESDSKESGLNLSLKASPKFALALAFVFMVVSAGIVFFFVYLGKVYAADIYAKRASTTIATNSDQSLMTLSNAINFNPLEAKYYVQLGQYYMALANQEASKDEKSRDINKIQQYLNNSIAVTSQAKKISPNDVGTVESLALIYENAGLYVSNSLSLAADNYKRAQELEPHNPIYFVKLGQLDIALAGSEKDTDKRKQLVSDAKDLFQKSIEKKQNYSEGYYQLALAQEALNELDQSIDSAIQAVNLDPDNINYILSLGRMYEERNKTDDLKSAEQVYQLAIKSDEKNVNGHFYLGLLYEKEKNKDGAKKEYNRVIELLSGGQNGVDNSDTISKLKKMVENVNAGISNTAENLGLTKSDQSASETPAAAPAATSGTSNSAPATPAATPATTPTSATPAQR